MDRQLEFRQVQLLLYCCRLSTIFMTQNIIFQCLELVINYFFINDSNK